MKTEKSKTIKLLAKGILYMAKKHTVFPLVYIVYSSEKRKTNSYIFVCVCVCVCVHAYDYTTEKYKRKMCYHQKNISTVKTFERLKYIKES